MKKQGRRGQGHWWLATLAMTAVLTGLLPWLHGWSVKLIIRDYERQLAAAPAAEVPDLLGRLAALGDPAIPALAAALASTRPEIATGAQEALQECLADWELLPPDRRAGRLAALSEALAAQTRHPSVGFPRAAAPLVARILAQPTAGDLATRERITAACALVLRAVQERGAGEAGAAIARREPEPVATPDRRDVAQALFLATAPEEDQGGPQASGPESTPSGDGPAGVDAGEAEFADEPPQPPALRPLPSDLGDARPLRPAQPATDPTLPQTPALDRGRSPLEYHRLETAELMQLLRTEGAAEVAAAERELTARGFERLHLELARRLTDPDPAVRRRWVEALPGLQDIDATAWLLWLAGDEDAQVRLAALTLLATSGDPRLTAEVVRLARDDPDLRVRALADHLK